MKRYLFKICPYLVLVFAYLGIGEYLLYQTGELRSIKSIVAEQLITDQESHFGKTLMSSNHLYFLEHLYQRKADIIVLGQSITHQFQSRMFHPMGSSFFNASNVFQTLDDLEFVISEIENSNIHRPEVIIWGLDPDYLKIQKSQKPYFANGADDPALEIDQHLRGTQIILKNVLKGNRDFIEFEKKSTGYGLQGKMGIGRRKDGSYDNSRIYEEYRKDPMYKERNGLKNLIDQKMRPFEYPLVLDQGLINQFKDLVRRVEVMEIDILFYCQQFSSDFMNHANQKLEFNSFWNGFTQICDSLEQAGYPMIPYGIPADIELDDRYMRDANHAAEVMTAFQLLNLLEKKGASIKTLRNIDLDHLKLLIENRKSEVEL